MGHVGCSVLVLSFIPVYPPVLGLDRAKPFTVTVLQQHIKLRKCKNSLVTLAVNTLRGCVITLNSFLVSCSVGMLCAYSRLHLSVHNKHI